MSGHRLGTAELESALVQHTDVVEAAVVSLFDFSLNILLSGIFRGFKLFIAFVALFYICFVIQTKNTQQLMKIKLNFNFV